MALEDPVTAAPHAFDVDSVDRQNRVARVRNGFVVVVLAILLVFIATTAIATFPRPFPLVLLLLIVVTVVSAVRPDFGVLAIISLALIGDGATSSWYPFAKNFSSAESALYVSENLPISPLEVVLAVTVAAWLFRAIGNRTWSFVRGGLLTPILVFACFVVLGLVYGLSRGGNLNVALWEARPLLYIPVIYILVTNVITTPGQRTALVVSAVAAIGLQSVLAIVYYFNLPAFERSDLERLTDHPATIHMNAVVVLLAALLLVPSCSWRLRVFVAVASIPISWAWVLSQRRAAAIALIVGVLLVGVIMLWRNRRAALWFIPLFSIFTGLYVAAFWNVSGGIGFGAQAVKSVLAPEALSAQDLSSNEYRRRETVNLWFTIRQRRLTGVGFGQQFYRPLPLADISVFPFWEYVPHNSLIWLYLKTGFLGFASMLFVFARAIQRGFFAAVRTTQPNSSALVVSGLGYVVMFMVFAYVDIAWDIRSAVFLAFAFYLCADVTTIEERADAVVESEELVMGARR